MEVFWARGFQGATISALTSSMGIGAPSLYAAFGSKADLFREAADLYQTEDGSGPLRAMKEASTAREGIEALLRANADLFTRGRRAKGCLLVRAVATCPPEELEVHRYLDRSARDRIGQVERRLRDAADAGEVLPSSEASSLARHLDAVVQGLAVHAFEGTSRLALHRTVDIALQSWDALAASTSLES
jgi:AcrR family transcriptional regulator